jgi:catechol 2,3-dioxygenase
MQDAAIRASAYLHHIQLLSEDPKALARFYATAMDMDLEEDGGHWRCTGPARTVLFAKGPRNALGYAAFACRDKAGLDEIRAQAEAASVTVEPSPSDIFSEHGFAVRDPEGRLIVFGLASERAVFHSRLRGPLQHLTLASQNVEKIEDFYANKLGFAVSDRVVDSQGTLMTTFMRSNHEHHTLACFRSNRTGVDHHSYEAGEWDTIRDWCDRLSGQQIKLMWGPGRHGPGNNLFVFIIDPDANWIEISAELEVIHDRPVKEWPHEGRTLNLWGEAILRAQDGVAKSPGSHPG